MTTQSPPWVTPLDLRFLALGLGLSLVGGTALGAAHLIWVYGLQIPSPQTHVQAHAHAQVFGFIGGFIAGFGYHLLPRFVRRPLPFPKLARASFWLLGGGAVLHFLGQPATRWAPGYGLMAASGPLLALGGVAFAAQVVALLRGFDSRDGFHRWVIAGAVGFGVACVVAGALSIRAGVMRVPLYPYPWAQALWTLALFGGVVPFTLGVGARMALPMLFGGRVRVGLLRTAFYVLLMAVPLQLLSNPLPALQSPAHAALGTALLMGAAAFLLPRGRVLPLSADPFFSACVVGAYLSVLIAGAAYLAAAVAGALGAPVNLIVLDAIRHLVTVGFLILLIVGMALRLLPALRGTQLRWPALRWWVFGLLALAVVTRSAEVLALFGWPGVLRATAASGALAWAGLALLAVLLVSTVRTPRREAG